MKHLWMFGALALTGCVTQDESTVESEAQGTIKNNHPFDNELGVAATYSTNGVVDLNNEFFLPMGTNDRQCGHCHKPAEGWTVSAASVRALFDRTAGLDPIFRTNDGTNSPDADVSTEAARRSAYSMLLTRGVIRVGLPVPDPNADSTEFTLELVDDPYHHANAQDLSLFRRPLPSANLKFIAGVMWDGRVSNPPTPVNEGLEAQSNGATQGHAAAPEPIAQETRESIVDFESELFNAQTVSHDAGNTSAEGARGGTAALVAQSRTNLDAHGVARWDLFDSWEHSSNAARRAVYRGQELFNNKTRITNPNTGAVGGQCRVCHNVSNVGSNLNGTFFSVQGLLGLDPPPSDAARRQGDQPLYTFMNKTSHKTVQTTDPGRALLTGKWADIGKFKVPSLRALGSRAPYFHGGSAATLGDVVDHYSTVLGFNFTAAEKADVVAFLSAL